jgi:hypothetical protein
MHPLKSILATAALSCAALFSSGANAALILQIDDLSTAGVDLTLADGAIGDWLGAGAILYAGSPGSWNLSATTGLGNGWSSIFGIDLNSVSVSSAAGGTLRISLTETDLAYGSGGPISVTSLIGGTTQGTVAYASWLDDGNAAFGKDTLLFSGTGTGAFSAAGSTTVGVSNPFSMTLQVDITHAGFKSTSFDFAAQIPEPGSLALLGLGLVGLALTRRKR